MTMERLFRGVAARKRVVLIGLLVVALFFAADAFQFPPLLKSHRLSHQISQRSRWNKPRHVPSSSDTSDEDAVVADGTVSSARTTWSTWFPLTFTAYTDTTRPTRHTLLGALIVVWKHEGTWFAMLDQCPHRLAPLSEGRILPDSGDIECPYHGWSFDGSSGNCTRIPQQAVNQTLPQIETRGCAKALACAERQGILWVHSGALYSDSNEIPNPDDISRFLVEPIDTPGIIYVDYMRDLPMEWSTLAENVMDPSHLPFTHHGTIGKRSQGGPFSLKLDSPIQKEGFTATRETTPPGTLDYRAPHLVYGGTFRNASFADWNVAYAVPTLPGRSRLLVRVVFQVSKMKFPLRYIFGTLFSLPAWMLHLNNHKILEDDNIFLHHQMHNYRKLDSIEDETYLPTESDATIIAFRRWLSEYGMQNQMWSRYTPAGAIVDGDKILTREALLERETAHTNLCTSCTEAYKWLGRIEPVLGVSALVCMARAVGGMRLRWIPGIVAGLAYLGKHKVSQTRRAMRVGEWPPPRNKT